MLDNYPALVLNADFRPLSLFPLALKKPKESIGNIWEDTVNVVAVYDRVVRSPSVTMQLPSVVALRKYVKPSTRVPFSPKNICLRDRHRCQYCGADHRNLTMDHVVPTSKGGRDWWDNVVACCDPCNARKGDTVGLMEPMKVPREPTQSELLAIQRQLSKIRFHATWVDYLPAEAA